MNLNYLDMEIALLYLVVVPVMFNKFDPIFFVGREIFVNSRSKPLSYQASGLTTFSSN